MIFKKSQKTLFCETVLFYFSKEITRNYKKMALVLVFAKSGEKWWRFLRRNGANKYFDIVTEVWIWPMDGQIMFSKVLIVNFIICALFTLWWPLASNINTNDDKYTLLVRARKWHLS